MAIGRVAMAWLPAGPSGEIVVLIERNALILTHRSWCLSGTDRKPVVKKVAITWTACR
jgi:hypothetical protein